MSVCAGFTVVALPTDVILPVRLALVTTVATSPEVVTPPVNAGTANKEDALTKLLPSGPRTMAVILLSGKDRPVPVVG